MELNDIYYGDAYELIKQIDDKSIDLIITDPPYEFGVGDICKYLNCDFGDIMVCLKDIHPTAKI